jgi:predicted RNase H-like HicB family nuclease
VYLYYLSELARYSMISSQVFGKMAISPTKLSSELKVTLLLETLASGTVSASVLEFPNCRVEAETRETALSQLQATFLERIQYIEALSWIVPVPTSQPDWMQFAGVFKDDSDFREIMDAMRAERLPDDDSEVDPSYYM